MIFVGADHNGFELKKLILAYLRNDLRLPAQDVGALLYSPEDDYPDFAKVATTNLLADEGSCAILICASGHGMSITANRQKNIRAAVIHSAQEAKRARNDDFINVLCLAATDFQIDPKLISRNIPLKLQQIIYSFLTTKPGGDSRFARRLYKIDH